MQEQHQEPTACFPEAHRLRSCAFLATRGHMDAARASVSEYADGAPAELGPAASA